MIYLICFIVILAVAGMYLLPFLAMIVGERKSKKYARNEVLDKIDFVNDKFYFRDIIDNYIANELLYIDEFREDEEKNLSF